VFETLMKKNSIAILCHNEKRVLLQTGGNVMHNTKIAALGGVALLLAFRIRRFSVVRLCKSVMGVVTTGQVLVEVLVPEK
jgi:hypothetical protein